MYKFYRFYIYPAQDNEILEPFAIKLKEKGFVYYNDLIPWPSNGQGKYFYFKKIPKTGIMVLRMDVEDQLADAISWVDRLEETADVEWFNLLGKVDIIAGLNHEHQETLEKIKEIKPVDKKQMVELELKYGKGLRLEWLWPEDKASYLFNFPHFSQEAQYFIEFELPCIEASLLKLDKINSYYREQKRIILKEKEALDQRLSRILHSSTVFSKQSAEQMEELENQLQSLSMSFGLIASNYSIILEGIDRIQQLINYSRYLIDKQKIIQINDKLYEKIFDYYFTKLKDLENLASSLRISRENYQSAISVIRSKLDIIISHESINTQNQIKNIMELNTSIQKQGLIFQFAAGLVEFIILSYYSHSLWKSLAYSAYHIVPGWLQFAITCIFSGITVYLTHLIAEYMQGEKHHRTRIIIFAFILLTLLIFIFASSFILDNSHLKSISP